MSADLDENTRTAVIDRRYSAIFSQLRSRGRKGVQEKFLSPARGDISPSARPAAGSLLLMPPLTGLGMLEWAHSNPTAFAVG